MKDKVGVGGVTTLQKYMLCKRTVVANVEIPAIFSECFGV